MGSFLDKEMKENMRSKIEGEALLENEYEEKLDELKKEIEVLGTEKDKKWRNFFMLIKDNRILRRTKGKLMREMQAAIVNQKNLE